MKSGLPFLIIDTSIWIDLIKSDLLDSFFRLHFVFGASDFVRDTESIRMSWDILEQKGLQYIELTPKEVAEMYSLSQIQRNTSAPDLACFFVARKTSGILLTGDKFLREYAESHVKVHGFLWVMDQLVNGNLLSPKDAITRLEKLQQDSNFRVPPDECQKMIKKWQKQL